MNAPSDPGRAPSWRSLVREPARAGTPLALGMELRRRAAPGAQQWGARAATTAHPRDLARDPGEVLLAVRPLLRSGATGNWIQGDVGWDAIRHGAARFSADQIRWFVDFLGIARESLLSGTAGDWIVLDHVGSRLLWPHLAAAEAAGIPLIATQKHTDLVPAASGTVAVRLERAGDDLRLRAEAALDAEDLDAAHVHPVGTAGLYAWEVRGDRIRIAFGPAEIGPSAAALLARGPVVIPPAERDAFLAEGYPRLARETPLQIGQGIDVPRVGDPVAVLTVRFRTGNAVDYSFSWDYPGFGRFSPAATADPIRDGDAERVAIEDVAHVWAQQTAIPFRTAGSLHEFDAAAFVTKVMPRLAQDGVVIETEGTPKSYRELTGDPEISVRAVESDKPDWFDLGFLVRIDGRSIPFQPLFTALAMRRTKLMLVDGTHLSLAHPALQRLRELLDEAAELNEWEPETPRIARQQVALWEDFEDLADHAEPAATWRATLEGLRGATGAPPLAPPTGLRAQLRPYQQAGYEWLAFLQEHRLGGILADDMGLGKTLQLLALVQRMRESGERRPALVVAPTSVLGTWREEAARFAPDLRVAVVDRTAAASGIPVADAVADADLVITSYTLLRLDEAGFAALDWSIKILDEAQFVKNPATAQHRAVAAVPSSSTFAVTGTPMENTLADLWALLQLTAPGLFPSARRFRQEYIQPIEQGKVPENQEGGAYRAERLARLRRRIRPLVLRRAKERVAAELPPKQEQVLHVDLGPAHRARYDTVLQRERQKVLGLLQDLDRNRFIVFRSLTLLRMLSLAPGLVEPQDEHLGSAKLDLLLERVAELRAEGHRALVFSQFTSFLQLAADRLERAGVPYAYLDGSTQRRDRVVDGFRAGEQPVFLISLKAGGFGLTLTEADYVFLLDPWWNPAAEEQAIDRTHRIGQDKQVLVYRLIASDTIEDKVLALQQRKARLFSAVMDDEEVFARSLTADDIRGLFEP